MNKVLVDTNVWTDVILKRPQFYDESFGALMACVESNIVLTIPATSLKDVFYFAVKSADSVAGYRAVELIMDVAELAPVDSITCTQALDLEGPDYEDGIVAACAIIEHVDAIITRDEKAFASLDVDKYSPAELLNELGYEPFALEP